MLGALFEVVVRRLSPLRLGSSIRPGQAVRGDHWNPKRRVISAAVRPGVPWRKRCAQRQVGDARVTRATKLAHRSTNPVVAAVLQHGSTGTILLSRPSKEARPLRLPADDIHPRHGVLDQVASANGRLVVAGAGGVPSVFHVEQLRSGRPVASRSQRKLSWSMAATEAGATP